ncbi:hypothetical protein K474DRAFT_1712634 [Panus rudis PR-1116 ss-1]|nr:hypothetical protein K474DRAFT_1712634 [Panus rudis PR-1116 ss-1]
MFGISRMLHLSISFVFVSGVPVERAIVEGVSPTPDAISGIARASRHISDATSASVETVTDLDRRQFTWGTDHPWKTYIPIASTNFEQKFDLNFDFASQSQE